MDSYDKTYLDIDELAKKIEERIRELEIQEKQEEFETEVELIEDYSSEKTEKDISDLDDIIRQIDERIKEFELEEQKSKVMELDVEDLTRKINDKLAKMEDPPKEDLERTIYDLSEISNAINETIKNLEAKKKRKKEMKAKYCDLARKKANKSNKKCNKK